MNKLKLKDLKSIHEWIRDVSVAEVFFVSLLIFPLFISLYSWAISITHLEDYRVWILITVSVLYILSLVIMKNNQSADEKLEVDLSIIKNHSKTFQLEYITFGKLQEKDSKFTEKYIRKLVRKYPSELIIAYMKSSTEKGVKLLKYSSMMAPDL